MKSQSFKSGRWQRYSLTIDERGTRWVRTQFWENVRLNLISWLGGVDRRSTQEFAREFMVPNGAAVRTVTEDGTKIENETITAKEDQCGLAVAPWASGIVVANCKFFRSLDSDTSDTRNTVL